VILLLLTFHQVLVGQWPLRSADLRSRREEASFVEAKLPREQ
jgi:hypothetical protein